MAGFEIEIVRQHWLADPATDLCSHGTVRLEIAGEMILKAEDDEVGISRSALALLRSLREDHQFRDEKTPQLVIHGCGFISMLSTSCGIGADWSVRHVGDEVLIADVVRFDRPGHDPAIAFNGVRAVVPWTDYRDQVMAFAVAAREFVQATPKKMPADQFERDDYGAWVTETDALIRSLAG